MNGSDLNRRQFTKLTAAAFGGVVAGSLVGCGKTPAKKSVDKGGNGSNGKNGDDTHDATLLTQEPHVCRGLNTCKDKGVTKSNACAGQGMCATAEKHTCAGENKCKGQGGCKEYPGQNSCKTKGEC
ncbi:MAG: hypothetical protein ACE5KM_16580, partial [Planctomycetaceae bacterium]